MTERSEPLPLWRRLQGWHQLTDQDLADAMGVTTRTIYRRKQGQRWTKAERFLLAEVLRTDVDLLDVTDDRIDIVLRSDQDTSRVVIHHNRHCVGAGQEMLFDPAAALIAA